MTALIAPSVMLRGTVTLSRPEHRVCLGLMEARFHGGDLRRLAFDGEEVLRGASFLVRDESWGIYAEAVHEEIWTHGDDETRYTRKGVAAAGALAFELEIVLRATSMKLRVNARCLRDFHLNRIGFVLLHPPSMLTGGSAIIVGEDGSERSVKASQLISPSQPATDFVGVRTESNGVSAIISMRGDLFEMEDQRNWGDASFKTYSRPLRLPRPFALSAGQEIRQEIEVALARTGPAAKTALATAPSVGTLPDLALALEPDWLPEESGWVEEAGVKTLLARLIDLEDGEFAAASAALARDIGAEVELELILPSETPATLSVQAFAALCRRARLAPRRITALPSAYMKSYQPEGPWPGGETPESASAAARQAFPGCEIGVGALTYFPEVNRRRPPADQGDFLTHGLTAIIHDAEDDAVVQTLDGARDILRSGRAIAGKRDYRLGLATIGMRTNPYGDVLSLNFEQTLRTMTLNDPRQRGLFAAAYLVGLLGACVENGVARLCVGAPLGAFGLRHRQETFPQLYFDQASPGGLFPIYHVVRALAPLSGARAETFFGAANVFLRIDGERVCRMVYANLSAEPQRLAARAGALRVLDAESFADAANSTQWLEAAATRFDGGTITLTAYAVAILDAETST